MVGIFTLFVAALAASCVSAAPLRNHNKVKTSALSATPTVDASIIAAASAASASAAAVQQALINAGNPGEGFTSPEFEGEEAFLNTKIELEQEAGDDAAAAADQEALSELNQSAGGGF
ncbi:hypothetical protein B0H13DRAFT_1905793 [Mycena leptocephala]|nr:hypothetical protein B0H13DRAFT_1905793 [Mycena leptocephala]